MPRRTRQRMNRKASRGHVTYRRSNRRNRPFRHHAFITDVWADASRRLDKATEQARQVR